MIDGTGSLEFIEIDPINIPGFDYPIQREIFNGIEKAWQLRELHQYILNHMARHANCIIQIAHLLNSNLVELKVQEKNVLLFSEFTEPIQLLLNEGQLLTIKKE
ncbi:hypothetical protein [Gracilibacillus boraciitolerans]|uniref:hypothetical protein n=1 Tax=Gracilibacillus boraciitolerans TaxID=307521 RepID=UPI001F2E0D6C|nr:hypothetical protein [Gracilibacillus boraciitolerans]